MRQIDERPCDFLFILFGIVIGRVAVTRHFLVQPQQQTANIYAAHSFAPAQSAVVKFECHKYFYILHARIFNFLLCSAFLNIPRSIHHNRDCFARYFCFYNDIISEFFFLNRKDVYCSNNTSPAKPGGLSAGAHAAVKQGCSTA
jgi:hypothetical protein